MYTLEIIEEVNNPEEAITLLEEIKRQLELGNTSGVYPTWDLTEIK